ncbi:hypothetical protein PR048_011211 [Dryococelus australis]|uniref:Uncharacterized protein n=1 Tax=Dryococelus australis TaxID=614101 RepID=A0ABQ9HKX3_9NEOP|nr:hypothetical protein PR048_011211 [Dryococelus australis]
MRETVKTSASGQPLKKRHERGVPEPLRPIQRDAAFGNFTRLTHRAPPHVAIVVRQHLKMHFSNQWIGRGGPIAWPLCLPNITPPDVWLWGYIKLMVYTTPLDTRDGLITPVTFVHVHRNMLQRCIVFVADGGRQFEQTL